MASTTIDRTATTIWQGDLATGSGTTTADSSGAWSQLPVSWAARTEPSGGGRTSPEELLASAHASCFSMALSHQLAQAGSRPDRLQVSATTSLTKDGDGITISAVHLDVQVEAAGLDDAKLQQAANAAKDGCPVSRALSSDVKVSVSAQLREPAHR